MAVTSLQPSLWQRRRGSAQPANLALQLRKRASDTSAYGSGMQKYTALQLIGRGSTGKVYRAQRCSDAQVVALKLMTAMDDDMLNCRRQEFEVLRGLSHPNIVQGLEFFSFPGSAVVVLSYHPGSTLTKAVQEAQGACLPEWQAQHLFCKLLSAIDYLHQRQIVHRDLKSDNVLVSEDVRELTLADFSTASVAAAGESLTMTGTQEWSAPEVLDWEAACYVRGSVLDFWV
ncbi:STK36 [Symbiodinium sp. CCMP2592]|nr:STK36 [Symbiodinium sp. CCMP2592]